MSYNDWIIYDGSEEPGIGDIYINGVDNKIRIIDSEVKRCKLEDGTEFCLTENDIKKFREENAIDIMVLSMFGNSALKNMSKLNDELYDMRIYAFLRLPELPERDIKEEEECE